MHTLTRAKHQQILMNWVWSGLFFGLVMACIAVGAIRVGLLGVPIWLSVGVILSVSLTVAVVIARLRRPDDVHVAILADIALGLKQRLSTAWEFERLGADARLRERLAAQAVRGRFPSHSEGVFPVRMNVWGRFVPVVGILLLFVSIVDIELGSESANGLVDEAVVREGVRLRDYARRLQSQSRGQGLERTVREAKAMQRLGTQMESGALPRREALSRLRGFGTELDEQRKLALLDGVDTRISPVELASLARGAAPGRARLRGLLSGLRSGRLTPGELRALASDALLEQLGIDAQALAEALARHDAGDDEALDRILDQLDSIDRVVREVRSLAAARDQVERARENLGDEGAWDGNGDEDGDRLGEEDSGTGGDELSDGPFADTSDGGAGGFDLRAPPGERSPMTFAGQPGGAGVIVKPRGELRGGKTFSSEARVMPRPGSPSVLDAAPDVQLRTRIEAVLAKEDFPIHHKELIRRYFLGLSRGGAGTQPTTVEQQQ